MIFKIILSTPDNLLNGQHSVHMRCKVRNKLQIKVQPSQTTNTTTIAKEQRRH